MIDGAAAAPPPPLERPVAELRALRHAAVDASYGALLPPALPVASIVDHRVQVRDGVIRARVYRPHGDGPLPAHLYLHGGGFWLGTLEQSDTPCCLIAAGAGCTVVSVGYRLAPEHRFPTQPEDCFDALQWLVANATELGVDAERISVGGPSAGGNLAAVLALLARDRGGPALVFQVLEVPVVDLTMSFPSIRENGEGYLLTEQAMRQYRLYYLRDMSDARHPYASPIFADDLTNLPPAFVITAEHDPLRDEGEAYARRLLDAGVPTALHRWPGQVHGSQLLAAVLPDEAAAHLELITGALRDAYGSVAQHASSDR